MTRAERLYALTEALRAAGSGGRTAESLAARFEVSARTIKRDMRVLVDSGVATAQEGRGGGYQLMKNAALPPLTFTAAEATAIALALAAEPHMPFQNDGNAALAKVLAALPKGARDDAHDTAGRLWMRGKEQGPRARCARVLDEALRRQVTAVLDYQDAQGALTKRRVDPLAFARTAGHWHLLAWCHTRCAGRWFRLDRVRAARLTREPATPRALHDVFGPPPDDARPLVLRAR